MKAIARVIPLLFLSVFLIAAGTGGGSVPAPALSSAPSAETGTGAKAGDEQTGENRNWFQRQTDTFSAFTDTAIAKAFAPFEPARNFFDGIGEGLNALGGLGDLLVGLFKLIGWAASILVVVTLFVLWAMNLVSPLDKSVNYVFVVVMMGTLAAFKGTDYFVVSKYLAVMASPFVLAYAFALIWRGLKSLLPRNSRLARTQRIGDLLTKLNAEVTELA